MVISLTSLPISLQILVNPEIQNTFKDWECQVNKVITEEKTFCKSSELLKTFGVLSSVLHAKPSLKAQTVMQFFITVVLTTPFPLKMSFSFWFLWSTTAMVSSSNHATLV